ncbi:hypothetical protein NDU88_002352 [Pleurodeles waltl]|uniref:Uncharacterized protein n=1 Tax=Pleurodeles waltl TaxID=8319 RepID=A0AAV7VEC0_PLEWA|nr:hypothetical protein NDU88_002352 [Pleurodeles waltl]
MCAEGAIVREEHLFLLVWRQGLVPEVSLRLKYVYAWNPRCPLGRRRFASTLPGLFTDPLLLLPVPVAEIQNGAPVPRVGEPGHLAG